MSEKELKILDEGKEKRSSGLVETQKEYKSWYSINSDFVFFNPGMLYWNTPLNRDLVSDYINIYDIPADQRPLKVNVPSALYTLIDPDTGIADSKIDLSVNGNVQKIDLSRMLYVCPNVPIDGGRTAWDKLDDFLTATAFVDKKTGYYARAVRQADLEILDYQSFASGSFSPLRIKVAAWGLYANDFTTIWRTVYMSEKDKYKRPEAARVSSADVTIKDGVLLLKEIR